MQAAGTRCQSATNWPTVRYHRDHGRRDVVERVGIRQFRDQLTAYLRRVRAGESLLIVDRDTPIAHLTPAMPELRAVSNLVAEGLAEWGGGKPHGAAQPPKVHGEPISDLLVEVRR